MANWNDPKLSQTWADRDAALRGKDESLAKMDFSGDTNIPEGAIRWNATNSRWEQYNSGSWSSLESTYNINVSSAQTASSANNLAGNGASYYDDAPNGTRMLFYQSSAPTGWNQITSVNDRVIRVVSGSGGSTGGSWSISGLNVLGHTLSVSEMPSHNHGMSTEGNHSHSGSTDNSGSHKHISGVTVRGGRGGQNPPYGAISENDNTWEHHKNYGGDLMPRTSNGGNHSHSLSINSNGNHTHNIYNTGGGNSHDHGITHNGNWRPAYADVIVCERSK
jgi:hypothetical protein